MDRYNGYVSNHDLYNGRGMASQTRYMSGPGGAVVSNQYKPMNMPPTKSSCESGCTPFRRYSGYDGGYNNDPIKPVVYEQPRPTHREVKKALFSHDGRDWTTGVCGCFEHGASCKCYTLPSSLALRHAVFSFETRFIVSFYLHEYVIRARINACK